MSVYPDITAAIVEEFDERTRIKDFLCRIVRFLCGHSMFASAT